MNEEDNGISIREFFKIVFSQKWLAIIVAVAITITCVLCCVYVYNPYVSDYVVSFRLNMPGDKSGGASYEYPDGETFSYTSLVSEKTLKTVKNSREEFADINVENMVKTGSISISEDLKVTPLNPTESLVERNYKISANCKYFPNKEIAKQFLTAVSSFPAKYLSEMDIAHDSLLKLYSEADDYLKQVEYLAKQLEYLEYNYAELLETYPSGFVIENGKSLKAFSDELTAYGNSFEFNNLSPELKSACYLKNENTKESYRIELILAEEKLEEETFILEHMIAGEKDAASTDSTGKTQASIVAELNRKVKDLKKFISDGVVDVDGVFAVRLENVYNKLTEYTNIYKKVSGKVYSNTVGVYFTDVNVVTVSGDIGLIKIILVSVALAIVVAVIVAFAVGNAKRKKSLANADIKEADRQMTVNDIREDNN